LPYESATQFKAIPSDGDAGGNPAIPVAGHQRRPPADPCRPGALRLFLARIPDLDVGWGEPKANPNSARRQDAAMLGFAALTPTYGAAPE